MAPSTGQPSPSTLVSVWVKPGAKRAAVLGFRDDGLLVVAVQAPATEGKANAALCQVVAQWLEVPSSWVTLQSGQQSRQKRLRIQLPEDTTKAAQVIERCQSSF